jgi:uridine kinase
MDVKVYVDVPADIRFIRRLKRDIEERDREVKSVVHQYLQTVRPMHEQFVEKTKNYADIIIVEGGNNQASINLVQEKIHLLLTA